MNYRIIITMGFFLALFTFIACSPEVISTPTPKSSSAPSIGGGGWEETWNTTFTAAKKEGSVIVYATSVAPAVKETVPIIKQKYGINVEVITGRGTEVRGRLVQERKAGIFMADIFISGLNTIYGDVKSSGTLDPLDPALILPEVLDPKAWFGGKLPWGDKEHMVFNLFYYPSTMININTDMVKPEEIKSLQDLLDPKWKNKIIINDPSVTGSGFNGFSSLIYNKVVDIDFFRKLVSQQNQMLRDQRLQADWLARAKYTVALWAVPEQLAIFQEAGAHIASVMPKEGTYLSVDGGGLVLVNRAPHPNAARIYTNWLLSKEGSAFVQNQMQQHSSRDDIPAGGIDPQRVRDPKGKYFVGANSIEEWVLNEQDRYLDMAKQTFSPLTEK